MPILRHKLPLLALAAATILLFPPKIGHAASPAALNENEIKAAAFYNVLAFTSWPSEAFAGPDAPLVVAVIGHGPIADLLDQVVSGETWRNRKIVVVKYATAEKIAPSHVLYIARSEHANWPKIRASCANRPILTVSDAVDFAATGGNVQLAIQQSRLRIFVNLAATQANGLQLSSNLLHLATIIGPIPQSNFRFFPFAGPSLCLATLH